MKDMCTSLLSVLNLFAPGVLRRQKTWPIVWMLCATSLLSWSGCTSSSPSPRAAAAQCDALAAHPQDAHRAVKDGVDDDRIAAGAAIPACQRAVEAYPDDARYAFQLGRASMAVGQTDKAATVFKKAIAMHYVPAFKYFGDLVLQKDPAQAKEMYEYAAEHGFSPAVAALAELQLASLNPKFFSDDLMVQLYNRDYSQIEALKAQLYITSLLDTLNSSQTLLLDPTCKPLVNALAHRWGGPLAGIVAWGNKAFELLAADPDRLGKNLVSVATILLMKSIIIETAEKDAIALVSNYGCQRPVTKTVYTNAIEYLTLIIAPKTAG